MQEGQCGREKGRGQYRQVTLSCDPWAHISGENKSAERQSLSFGLYLLLWVRRCTCTCEYEFTLLFLCSITSCSLNCWAVSALWRGEVSHNVWFCAHPLSAEQTNRWWEGGLSNYFTNEKLKPMKMKPFDKGCVGEQGQSLVLNANTLLAWCFNHRVINIHVTIVSRNFYHGPRPCVP